MLYLKASTSIETLDEYNGEKGMFIKTFAVNDQRNKNGWRLTWESIKKRIGDFIGFPGIEYMKCEDGKCDLDHIDASTYQNSLEIQKPFSVTTIKDYTLNEDTHTAFFVHQTDNAEFFAKVKSGEISFVSPAVWPKSGAYDILPGKMPNGEPILDVYDWMPLHDAFLTHDPAYGDVAKVTATCEGQNCEMKLLTAKEIQSSEELRKEFDVTPALIKHKDHLVFVSLKSSVSKQVEDLFEENSRPDTTSLMAILKNNSFSSCSCSSKISMSPEETLKAELETTKTALKAATQNDSDKDKKIKDLESKIAQMEKAKEAAKNDDDESDGDDDNNDDESDGENTKPMKNKQGAKKAKIDVKRITVLEAKIAAPLIEEMLSAREIHGATTEEIDEIRKSLTAKSLEEIELQYKNEKVLIKNLKAKEEPALQHFEFNGGKPSSLKAKSFEELFEEVEA